MLFARRNQCFARIIHANFIFGGQSSVADSHYPRHGLPAVSQNAAAGTFLLQLRFRELPCAGSRPVLPTGQETVLRVRCTVSARLQPRQILPELRRCHEAQKRRCTQAETAAEMSRFRGEKNLVNQGLSERCQ